MSIRLTESRLRQIIREELEGMEDPQAKLNRIADLNKKYTRSSRSSALDTALYSYGDKLEAIAGIAMEAIAQAGVDPKEVIADPDGAAAHAAWNKFGAGFQKAFRKVIPADKERFGPYAQPTYKMEVDAYAIRDFWTSFLNAGLDLETMKRDHTLMRDLQAEFEDVDVSDLTDSMYGRRSYETRHKGTGQVMKRFRDREGSLGS
jgi:hypothetical protein